MIALFGVVIFFRSLFPSAALYWATYFVMFIFVALFWYVSFWVSRRKAEKIIGKEPEFDVFCGKVPQKETDDLERGRLCICDGMMILVHKKDGKQYMKILEIPIDDITSIGYGLVVGKRRGFTVYYGKKKEVSFTCSKISEKKQELYKALGWDFPQETE